MGIYNLTLSNGNEHIGDDQDAEEAMKLFLDEYERVFGIKDLPDIVSVKEIVPAKPDNSYKEQDGGYLFTGWGIHVAADSLEEAKRLVKEYHGKDVDKDPAPKGKE